MSFKTHELDSSLKEEQATIIVGRHIILKLVEKLEDKKVLEDPIAKTFLSTPDLAYNDVQKQIRRLIEIDTAIEKLVLKGSYLDFLNVLSDTKVSLGDVTEGLVKEFNTLSPRALFTKIANDMEKTITDLTKIDGQNYKKLFKIIREEAPQKFNEATKKGIEKLNKEVLLIEKSLKKKNKKWI